MSPGFWSGFGAGASVDWCEVNYAKSPFVAEWWNALSSLLLIGVALLGLRQARRIASRLEPRFLLLFGSLAAIGLGSFAFHTTLLRSAQALDELPMFFAALLATYAVHVRRTPMGTPEPALAQRLLVLQLLLALCAVVFVAGYLTTPHHALFLGAYAVFITYAGLATLKVAFSGGSALFRRLTSWAVGLQILGMLGFWLPEHVWLGCDHPLQALELHSLYHLCAGFSAYAWVLGLVVDRREQIDGRPLPAPSLQSASEAVGERAQT
jgi:hypothetical protein